MPNCERCGKYISGLEVKRYHNHCYKCYRQWLREMTPFFLFGGRAGNKGIHIPFFTGFLKRPFKRRKKEDGERRKTFMTCNVCGHFPLSIDSISKESYSNEYRIITKCSKCKDFEIEHVSKEAFDKLELQIYG